MLGLIAESVGGCLRAQARLALEDPKQMPTRRALELLQFVDRNHGCERRAFALDDELIVPESDSVQKVAEAPPNFEAGNCFGHDDLPYQLS